MATDEAIFRGAPAEFESAVRVYDRQLGARLGVPLGTMLIFKTYFTPGVPQRLDIAEVCVAVSDLPLAEAALSPMGAVTYTGPVYPWHYKATITAHALPDRRSHLFLQCEEAIWPGVEPHWQALLAELSRLGYIESAEPEPHPEAAAPKQSRGGGSVPEPLEERARCVFEWEKARDSQPGLSAAAFVASREDVFTTGSSLYRWRRDLEVQAYIERHYRSSVITQQRES